MGGGGEEEEEIPLKIIELSDFLRFPSTLTKSIQLKCKTNNDQFSSLNEENEEFNGSKFKDKSSRIILLKQKMISPDIEDEFVISKDIIIFADDIDRKKLGLMKKSTNHFSKHLLITSGVALQALIPSLTNAKEWIILSKLKYSKRFTKQFPIQGNVVISLNLNHPLVRYEILTAFDFLQQSFNELKSAYIVIDFSQILTRWFKNYLKRTDQYPSLPNRLLYRYEILTNKCSITMGKRNSNGNNAHQTNLHKMFHKSDIPLKILINFNSLPTIVYTIQLNNIFIYSMNDQYKQICKKIENGLSLVSIQNINSLEDQTNTSTTLVRQEKIVIEKLPLEQIKEMKSSSKSFYEPNEEEKMLFEKVLDNRRRIQMQHHQLMIKAAKMFCSSSMNNDSFISKNTQITN